MFLFLAALATHSYASKNPEEANDDDDFDNILQQKEGLDGDQTNENLKRYSFFRLFKPNKFEFIRIK